MKRGRIVLLITAVSLPFFILTYLGIVLMNNSVQRERERYDDIYQRRVEDAAAVLETKVAEIENRFFRISEAVSSPDPAFLRELSRKEPLIRQAFLLNEERKLAFPRSGLSLSAQEEDFLNRTESIWESGIKLGFPPGQSAAGEQENDEYGWHVWFWGNGANFIYYYRMSSGDIFGIEAERTVFAAKLIESLPMGERAAEGRFVLKGASGEPLYIWGNGVSDKEAAPEIEISLDHPLNSFRIAYWPDASREYRPPWAGFILGLVSLALVLSGLVFYYYRETYRESREARRKITFVNQVSHELKTPLTNILLYLELIQLRRDSLDTENRRSLTVVLSETERLRRLITNILTFGKKDSPNILHPEPVVPDEVTKEVIARFALAFEIAGIKIVLDLHAGKTVMMDQDAYQQILGNLLSNVEKYAAAGKKVLITTEQQDDITRFSVRDFGPGIPAGLRKKIFKPFYRGSHNLTDAAGTGIGLAIVMDLVKRHRGDVQVENADSGARFTVTLHTPLREADV
jgi:signal transduction histidine kinase